MAAQREPYEAPAMRAFATELEAWRTHARLTKTELAERLGYTPQLIGQIEAAKNIPSQAFAEDCDTFFETNGLFKRLWKLINETRHLAVLPPGFPDFVEREGVASWMYIFETNVITGIFQTPEYARELLKPGRTEDEAAALVAKRMERQTILTRKHPARIVVVFDESAVRRQIGDREVMRGQYQRLIELAEQPNITMHIVPSTAGAYAGLPGAFFILGFEEAPDLIYTEGHVGGQLTEHRSTAREYHVRYDLIRGAAMSADDTLALLNAALESM